jgi:hypothetical protein
VFQSQLITKLPEAYDACSRSSYRRLRVASSFVHLAFFYTNLIEYYSPRMDGDTLVFPIYLPEDFRAPFADPLTPTGPAVLEIFATFRRVTGKKVAYRSTFTREGLLHYFPSFGTNDGLVREILGMAEYAMEYGYYRKDRDLLWSRQVNPNSVNWEQFLRTTGWQGQAQTFGV